jgi:hypothetical protein
LELTCGEKFNGQSPVRQGWSFDGSLDVDDRKETNEVIVLSYLNGQKGLGSVKFREQPGLVQLEQFADSKKNILRVLLALVTGKVSPCRHKVALLEAVSKEKKVACKGREAGKWAMADTNKGGDTVVHEKKIEKTVDVLDNIMNLRGGETARRNLSVGPVVKFMQ